MEFEIQGRKFKLGRLDAMKQFHIVRRMGPILSDLLPAMKDIAGSKNFEAQGEEQKLETIAKFVAPISTGLSKLTDDDANLVLYGLLSSVEVQQSAGNWAWVATPKMIMIQDLELPVLIQLAGRAFMHNLSSFFSASQAK